MAGKQNERKNGKMRIKQEQRRERRKGRKRRRAVFCSTLPFSTLEHHWWHVQPLKLLANRLSPFALSPCIIGVKGRRASQLMSQRAPQCPSACPKLPQFNGRQRLRRRKRTWLFSFFVVVQLSVETH